MLHRTKTLPLLAALCFLQSVSLAFAVDSEANREDLVAPRSKKLYRSNSVRKYLSLGGSHTSDYNSKYSQLNAKYFYQSQNFINEVNFKNENKYSDSGSSSNRRYDVKTSELYDLSLSSKMRLGDSENYGVAFHRTMYDDLSKYYLDTHTALGVGRMFFNDKIELDLSVGYHDIKTYGHKIDFIPSIRTNFKITKNLTLIQRGYWFIDHESMDNELKSSLVYRMRERLSLELRHNFEQRRYEDDHNRVVTNQINRSTTIGLVFDLE
jgi:hypothetical protein